MEIKIYPEDLIKRCVWDSYVYYVVGSDKEAQDILKNNEEMVISERDALVIGLLKVIETTNLIHKFNSHTTDLLANKSTTEEGVLLIRKKTLDTAIEKFLNKFPDYWEPTSAWTSALKDLVEYLNVLKNGLENTKTKIIDYDNYTSEFYFTNMVKKMLKFHY